MMKFNIALLPCMLLTLVLLLSVGHLCALVQHLVILLSPANMRVVAIISVVVIMIW